MSIADEIRVFAAPRGGAKLRDIACALALIEHASGRITAPVSAFLAPFLDSRLEALLHAHTLLRNGPRRGKHLAAHFQAARRAYEETRDALVEEIRRETHVTPRMLP